MTDSRRTATRDRIFYAAQNEFASHGFGAARVERICRLAKSNIRMLYHYFGGKERLYLKVLEKAYIDIRSLERDGQLQSLEPEEGMQRLVEITFDFLATDPHFVRIIMNENLLSGRIVRKSRIIPEMTGGLVDAIERILVRGQEEKVFHADVNSVNLYLTILGLCWIHVSNRHTLSNMFKFDFSDPEWLASRKIIITEIVMNYLKSPMSEHERMPASRRDAKRRSRCAGDRGV